MGIIENNGLPRRGQAPLPCKGYSVFKISRKYSHYIFGAIQSGITCAIAAAIASLPFMGGGTFLTHWVHAYLFSWAIMLPLAVTVAPGIRRMVCAITE